MQASRKAWILTWIFAILPLLGWWLYGLLDMDEGFYGAVVAEMNRRGEWITPFYNGHPWFEKPILLYWVAKPFMLVFGDVFGPRIPSILATIGTYLLIAWFARRRWDDHVARWCVLIAASSVLLVGVGRMMMTDALLSFSLTGAFIYFYESLAGNPRWRWLAGFFLGLSVLAKGPVGVILFAPVAIWLYVREPGARPGFRGGWVVGILIFLATVATWYLPAYLVNREVFVQKFLIEQNLNRFTGGDLAHTPPYLLGLPMYFLVLLVGMAPWSFYIWKAWPRKTETDPVRRYLVVWALVPFIFFTISKAKLVHYVLPCCVPLSLLVGCYLSGRSSALTGWKSIRFPAIACAVVALLVNSAMVFYYTRWHAEVHQLAFVVRDQIKSGEDVQAYQMPRRERALGTMKPTIQETSHPSLVMYLNREIGEPDTIQQLIDDPNAQWVITRRDRISADDIAKLSKAGREIRTIPTDNPDHYRLYYLSQAPGARTRR